jgi:hypothetical protein
MDIIIAVLLTIITWVQTYRRFQKLASVFLPTPIVNCKASRPRSGDSGPTNDSISLDRSVKAIEGLLMLVNDRSALK